MKGSPAQPRCGFSTKMVDLLKGEGVGFASFDIFSDEEVRQGLKTYSNWPTYPQLYVHGALRALRDHGCGGRAGVGCLVARCSS